MRRFACEHCGNEVRFDVSSCPVCGSLLAYVPDELTIRQLVASADGASFRIAATGNDVWRCLNAAWGCNWVLPAATGTMWCRACAITRGRPDDGRPDAIDAWAQVEAVKRRLVHQLDQLGLPVEPRSPSAPAGLAFDLVHVPGERGLTGHLDGVVTIDLAEADPVHRDEMRRRLGEPYRTLIGNLRHEIGHHYWQRLVGQGDHLDRFRSLFGDERAEYAAALERYYAVSAQEGWDEQRFVTGYARAHPHEDWADTFAHYLHIVDLVGTAFAHGLIGPSFGPGRAEDVFDGVSMRAVLHQWNPIARAIDDLAEAVGSSRVYPFRPAGAVVDKLEFVHARVTELTERGPFRREPVDAHPLEHLRVR